MKEPAWANCAAGPLSCGGSAPHSMLPTPTSGGRTHFAPRIWLKGNEALRQMDSFLPKHRDNLFHCTTIPFNPDLLSVSDSARIRTQNPDQFFGGQASVTSN